MNWSIFIGAFIGAFLTMIPPFNKLVPYIKKCAYRAALEALEYSHKK